MTVRYATAVDFEAVKEKVWTGRLDAEVALADVKQMRVAGGSNIQMKWDTQEWLGQRIDDQRRRNAPPAAFALAAEVRPPAYSRAEIARDDRYLRSLGFRGWKQASEAVASGGR